MARMATEETNEQAKPNSSFGPLWRFLPMLWPKGQAMGGIAIFFVPPVCA